MLNNRLEDLIYKYKSYRIKRFKNFVKSILFLSILIGGIYSIYLKLNIYNKKSKNIDISKHKEITNKKVTQKQNKELKPVIVKIKPENKIDEEKILKKQSLKTLLMVEKNKPTYETAYDLAKYYFDNGDYKKASKWAVVASNREPKYDKAWILYAKSKIKLNQKGIAKKALKIYLLKYHSREVSNLLNSL